MKISSLQIIATALLASTFFLSSAHAFDFDHTEIEFYDARKTTRYDVAAQTKEFVEYFNAWQQGFTSILTYVQTQQPQLLTETLDAWSTESAITPSKLLLHQFPCLPLQTPVLINNDRDMQFFGTGYSGPKRKLQPTSNLLQFAIATHSNECALIMMRALPEKYMQRHGIEYLKLALYVKNNVVAKNIRSFSGYANRSYDLGACLAITILTDNPEMTESLLAFIKGLSEEQFSQDSSEWRLHKTNKEMFVEGVYNYLKQAGVTQANRRCVELFEAYAQPAGEATPLMNEEASCFPLLRSRRSSSSSSSGAAAAAASASSSSSSAIGTVGDPASAAPAGLRALKPPVSAGCCIQ